MAPNEPTTTQIETAKENFNSPPDKGWNGSPQYTSIITATSNLLATLKASGNFGSAKSAIIEFIETMGMDACMLGDGDLCGLAADALESRGKSLEMLKLLGEANMRRPKAEVA